MITIYTLQQNRVVERKNRTIVEIERSMMKAKGLQIKYWEEVVPTVVYMINTCPTKLVHKKIPL